MNIATVCGLIKALAPAADPEVIEQAVSDWLDDHPEATTTVEDGSITVDKLASALAAEIAEISDKYEKPSGGIPSSDMASAVQTSLGKADSAYQKPGSGIPASDLAESYIEEPASEGTSGQVLTTDGNGGRTWTTVQGGGGGGATIDDTAGHGDTTVVWSAGKTYDEIGTLSSAIDILEPTASASDVGKYMKVKTVADGKVTAYEFGASSGSGAQIDDTAGSGDTTVTWSADKSTEELAGKADKDKFDEVIQKGYYTTGGGSATHNVYIEMTSGGINNLGNATSDTSKGYVWLTSEQESKSIQIDTTVFSYNLCYKLGTTVKKYTGWTTTSPIAFDSTEHDTIGITVKKTAGGAMESYLANTLYYTEGSSEQIGELATRAFVKEYFSKAAKCIYPDGFTSRIKPDIYNNGRFVADIDIDSYKASGTGEVWVATDGNDTTGTGAENNPYATITKALTISAATIHIKEGTYTQGTHYTDSVDFSGKNIIGHGTVALQNDSSGHFVKATASAYIENITFKHGNATSNAAFYAGCTASGQTVCFVGCTFRDGGTNGLTLEGIDAVVVECVAYGNKLDGFNYHAKTVSSTTYVPNVLEIDCVAYNNGSNSSGSDSCNGSTAHDGTQIIRLNGEYYSCYGGVIAEIGGTGNDDPTTKSVNFGVLAHESTGTGTYNASFWASYNTIMYLYDCKSFGSTYDISAINDGKVVSWRLTTGSDNPSKNTGASATVIEH